MKLNNIVKIFVLILLFGVINSCKENIDEESYYTFTGETVASFCKNSTNLSVFTRIMEESENYSLLSIYGHFTCFAPTDAAFEIYFQEKGLK